jgi:hypothetical protein
LPSGQGGSLTGNGRYRLSVERRFRFYGADGFAAYIAGGVDRVPLIGKLTLDTYGQAGYSLGGISSPFADAQARVQHPLAKPLGIPVRIGAGAWVGGQKGAYRAGHRADPALSAQVDNPVSPTSLCNSIGGNAWSANAAPVEPAGVVASLGLALTVATDF